MPRDGAPLVLGFADLFDHLGTDDLRYSAACAELSGRDVVDRRVPLPCARPARRDVAGRSAGPLSRLLAGAGCGHHAARRVVPFPQEGEDRPVRVVGRLDYGFRIDGGVASILRIERAAVLPVESERVKQLIHGGRMLTAGRLDGAHADLLIDGDTIVAVMPPGESVTADAKRIDAAGRLLIPGLVNAHTHATVALGKGMADRWSLELLLNAYAWTAGGRTAETKYLSAQIGALEMLRKGCTACYDLVAEIPAPSVEGIKAVAQAYADVGMRAAIAPMMADTTFYRAIPGLIEAMPPGLREKAEALKATPYDVSLATCRTLVENWSFDRDQLRPALGPTIPHHCSDAFIVGCRDLAKAHGIGVQMHVAESKVQAVVGPRKIRHHAGRPSAQARPDRRRTSRPRTRSGSTTMIWDGSPTPALASRTIPAAT